MTSESEIKKSDFDIRTCVHTHSHLYTVIFKLTFLIRKFFFIKIDKIDKKLKIREIVIYFDFRIVFSTSGQRMTMILPSK